MPYWAFKGMSRPLLPTTYIAFRLDMDQAQFPNIHQLLSL